jgi:hypothetical protein
MRRSFALIGVLVFAQHASADGIPLTVGLAPSTYTLSDGSRGFAPEAFVHTYVPLGSGLIVRPGARLGVRGVLQPEMPEGVRITERELTGLIEAAISYNGTVVPSLTVMSGIHVRRLGIEGDGVDVGMSQASATELLPNLSVQLGVGLPLARGTWLVEPTIRRELLFGDSRAGWRFGLEVSMVLPI